MSLYKEIHEKLLDEVDEDIRDIMTKPETTYYDFPECKKIANVYQGFELIDNPAETILLWQSLRDRKKQNG